MKSFPFIVVFLIDFSCLSGQVNQSIPVVTDRESISQVIHNSIGWAAGKDTALLFSCFVQDSTFFIFHPDEGSTIRDFESIRKVAETFWLDPRFVATEFEVRELEIQQSPSGETAWFSARLDDFGTWDGKPIGWKNVRWTGVLLKMEGSWRICQMHFSFASDK